LIGSVIVGDASVVTEKEGTIRLWHICFGHMSEQDLQALHNKGALSGIKYYKFGFYKFCIMVR